MALIKGSPSFGFWLPLANGSPTEDQKGGGDSGQDGLGWLSPSPPATPLPGCSSPQPPLSEATPSCLLPRGLRVVTAQALPFPTPPFGQKPSCGQYPGDSLSLPNSPGGPPGQLGEGPRGPEVSHPAISDPRADPTSERRGSGRGLRERQSRESAGRDAGGAGSAGLQGSCLPHRSALGEMAPTRCPSHKERSCRGSGHSGLRDGCCLGRGHPTTVTLPRSAHVGGWLQGPDTHVLAQGAEWLPLTAHFQGGLPFLAFCQLPDFGQRSSCPDTCSRPRQAPARAHARDDPCNSRSTKTEVPPKQLGPGGRSHDRSIALCEARGNHIMRPPDTAHTARIPPQPNGGHERK